MATKIKKSTYFCGCIITGNKPVPIWRLCPIHTHAEEMLTVLETISELLKQEKWDTEDFEGVMGLVNEIQGKINAMPESVETLDITPSEQITAVLEILADERAIVHHPIADQAIANVIVKVDDLSTMSDERVESES